jgi:hypothetical protein
VLADGGAAVALAAASHAAVIADGGAAAFSAQALLTVVRALLANQSHDLRVGACCFSTLMIRRPALARGAAGSTANAVRQMQFDESGRGSCDDEAAEAAAGWVKHWKTRSPLPQLQAVDIFEQSVPRR